MNIHWHIAFARLASTFDVTLTPDGSWLFDDELQQAARLANESGFGLRLREKEFADILDFAGAIELAHLCTYFDVTKVPMHDMKLILDQIIPQGFRGEDSLFGAAAQLQKRLSASAQPIEGIDLTAYSACERYLLLVHEVRQDEALTAFLRSLHDSELATEQREGRLESPVAFSEALVGGSRVSRERDIEGGLHAVEHLRTLRALMRQLSSRQNALDQCLRTARWTHQLPMIRLRLDRWVEATGSWPLPSGEMSGRDYLKWFSFILDVVVPIEDDLRRLGIVETSKAEPTNDIPSMQELERQQIKAILKRHNWRVTSAAQEMNVEPRSLYRRMKKHGIKAPRLSPSDKAENR